MTIHDDITATTQATNDILETLQFRMDRWKRITGDKPVLESGTPNIGKMMQWTMERDELISTVFPKYDRRLIQCEDWLAQAVEFFAAQGQEDDPWAIHCKQGLETVQHARKVIKDILDSQPAQS